ncbi:hypothetical protein FGE12_24925 [Aggregicoccus sp. 17bor-14]|uniref:hypothetical protein n=1 Tax=Myxococcaceae TaxID=31 RepID=UPI00129D17DF|nr:MULTISPECIES: hypothetical protein [Myxococcaceae]MBF5045674.1 hypothetical protein [Simulacricoccus sp. 17bor-14]MRI91411.1 hypothetical protein [Aggregicoccus sp. 17bor-14]
MSVSAEKPLKLSARVLVEQGVWGAVAVIGAFVFEGLAGLLDSIGYTTSGAMGDCIGVGSKVGALAVCALLAMSARWYGRRAWPGLWATIVAVESLRFIPSLAILAFIASKGSLVPATWREWWNSAFLWWPLMALACVASAWILTRKPRQDMRQVAVSILGGLTFIALVAALRSLEPLLPWAWLVAIVAR